MAERVSVTELNNRVRDLLGSTPYLKEIWVVGEISNLTIQSSGHAYFSIKDAGAAVSAAMFRNALSRIDFRPANSMKIEAFGHVDLYAPAGRYQFIVETMKRSGVGELYQEYERLKKKLEGEGLFDKARKRPLPKYPKTIGVVTSPTGAVIHDILTTTARLHPVDILLAPAKVQGDGAADSIVKGIEILNRAGVDVIIVGRGGGSLEDLWAFNEEKVVRAIAASKVPIISSVGHETDFTLSDFAADMRAPTPTGAAEMAVRDKREILREVEELFRRAGSAVQGVYGKMLYDFQILDAKLDPKRAADRVNMEQMALDDLENRAKSALNNLVNKSRNDALMLFSRIEPDINSSIQKSKGRLDRLWDRPDTFMASAMQKRNSAEAEMSARLDALNPYSVLERGYSFITDENGDTVTSSERIEVGSSITVRMRDGKVNAEVTGKERI